MVQNNEKFQLNHTDINNIGFKFDSTSVRKYYEDFISPFEDDSKKAHPFNAQFPQCFTILQFQLDKVTNKLAQDTLIYIFYNIIDQRLQLGAARQLMNKGLKYHKAYKIWIRRKDQQLQYFNINQWKYTLFPEKIKEEDYYHKIDFADK